MSTARVHRFSHDTSPWQLSIATHATPHHGALSLGGFRIAPPERTERPDYDNDREAVGLADGMEAKIHWSRLIGAGGPVTRRLGPRLSGGKCVLLPTSAGRVGAPRDVELLDFALASFAEFERETGIALVTGQDLGHGMMSDGVTSSLRYLNDRFAGSVLADTSKPTAEGNFHVLAGALDALDIPLDGARVGLIGCGNIGEHVLSRLLVAGARVAVLESSPAKRAQLVERGLDVTSPEGKRAFMARPMDALVINAGGGTLDPATVGEVAANREVRIVCGCENLIMPVSSGENILRDAGKVFIPTEFGGMMGYLTAVEEYL
ncbi:MAG: hypothetical protein H7066_15265, partial [Cytophagaceae bacterium]|nr:hypothetical protein [Gemmatimonadaceae bacterium]